jgi:hypothetical protein
VIKEVEFLGTSRQSAHEGGNSVSPTDRPLLLPSKYSWYSLLLQPESTPRAIVRPEGLSQWKISMAPAGIQPTTSQLVALCPNRLRHRVHYFVVERPLLWICTRYNNKLHAPEFSPRNAEFQLFKRSHAIQCNQKFGINFTTPPI